nr:MADS-box transcription factor [Spirodela polyrhiza]
MASASATKRGAQRRGKKPWARREQGLKKKAAELSTLCGVDVCIVGYNDAGDFFSWPDDLNEVERIAGRLKEQQGNRRRAGPSEEEEDGGFHLCPHHRAEAGEGGLQGAGLPPEFRRRQTSAESRRPALSGCPRRRRADGLLEADSRDDVGRQRSDHRRSWTG